MIGLRYKNNSTTLLETDIFSFYGSGTTFTNKSKNIKIENSLVNTLDFDLPLLSYVINYLYSVINNLYSTLQLISTKPFTSGAQQGNQLFNFSGHYYNTIMAYDELIFNLVRVLQNVNVWSLTSLYQAIDTCSEVIAWNFN